jgi:hypothetical protein
LGVHIAEKPGWGEKTKCHRSDPAKSAQEEFLRIMKKTPPDSIRDLWGEMVPVTLNHINIY